MLSLIDSVLGDVARRWHGNRITADDLEKLNALRAAVAPHAARASTHETGVIALECLQTNRSATEILAPPYLAELLSNSCRQRPPGLKTAAPSLPSHFPQ